MDNKWRIVGWAADDPVILAGGVLRHAEAERLIGPFKACYVEINDPADAAEGEA